MLSTKIQSILTAAIAFLLVISFSLYARQEQRQSGRDGQESGAKTEARDNSQAHERPNVTDTAPADMPQRQETSPSPTRNREATSSVEQDPHAAFAKEAQSKNFAITAATSRRTVNTPHKMESNSDIPNTNFRSSSAEEHQNQNKSARSSAPSRVNRTVDVSSATAKTETASIRQGGRKSDWKTQASTATEPSKTVITRSNQRDNSSKDSVNNEKFRSNERTVSNFSTDRKSSKSSIRQRFNDSTVHLNTMHASVDRPIATASRSFGSVHTNDSHERNGRGGETENRTKTGRNNTTNIFVNNHTSYPYVSRNHGADHHEGNQGNVNIINVGFNNFGGWPRRHFGPAAYHGGWNRWRPYWYYYGSTPAYYTDYTWIRPSCGTIVYYQYNHRHGVSYIYPDYHRKYVFVSIGGYWPVDYTYQRYYWYGCHPEVWYGAYPQEYVVNEVNNYNTYSTNNGYTTYDNYSAPYASIEPTYMYDSSGNIIPDYSALSQVREKLAIEQAAKDMPQEKTAADENFEKAVNAFAEQKYDNALSYIREAIRLEPEDIVMPFVYCQVLFAKEDYSRAAGVLRAAISNLPEDKKAVLFPRGLYSDEKILNTQIEQLSKATANEVLNGDLQLLLGYQLLGVNKFNEAKIVLTDASKDVSNKAAADILLELLDQAKTAATSTTITN